LKRTAIHEKSTAFWMRPVFRPVIGLFLFVAMCKRVHVDVEIKYFHP